MAYLVQTIATKFIFLILIFSLTKAAISLPFVVFLGIGETCQSMEEFIQILEKDSGNHGHCIMLGDNVEDSVLVPIMDQVTLACQKVKELDELKNGYNLIGISQGGLISRGMIEFCDEGPQVKNFISVGGPQAGVAGAPNCSFPICARLTNLLNLLPVYSTFIQASVAPSNYIKIPTEIDAYLKGCKFLPYANNEIPSARNPIYKKRFSRLHNLVLIMFEEETIITPRESSWFGYYPDGSTNVILPFNETQLYKEDLIGLKALHEAGKVTFKKAPGEHVNLSDALYEMISPFLKDESSTQKIAVA
ncbi:uncharacterized protein LOC141592277 isoform X1 [Silene latifolia]|uniref:uncharacterized protein LOC141592277 isoform X1 n=1 Tax=Silene latifolia TaxID=37657 RepID=UPI003D76BAE2